MAMPHGSDKSAQNIERNKAKSKDEDGDDLSQQPGFRLRALRMRHGFSQRDLARRAGITNGSVSMIEQGQVSPSVASLKKLAEALSMTLAEFFSDDLEGSLKPFFRSSELVELGDGAVSLRMVPAGVANPKLQVLHEVYQPDSDTGPELLSHPGEEAGVVVKGSITITVGGEVAELGPGDSYYFDSRLPHRFRNSGDDECEIVSTATPPSF